MGLYVGPPNYRGFITDGLEYLLDVNNRYSYDGSTTMNNLMDARTATINGPSYNWEVEGVNGVRLDNSVTSVSHIQLPSITNITTVSLWYYVHTNANTRYLLDMRTGGSNGWIYSGGQGSDWASGSVYRNGIYIGTPIWSRVEPSINNWINITVIANNPSTDDINLFSRYSDNQGYDVTFAVACIYNRALSASEILQNFNYQNARFNI